MSEQQPGDAPSVWGVFTERADATPDDVMLIDERGRRATFASLLAFAERVAAGLAARGVTPGSVVSWQLPTRIDTVVVSLALSRLDVIQNPIIPIYRRREVEAMVRQCGADWLITLETFRGFAHGEMAEQISADTGGHVRVLVLSGALPEDDPAGLSSPKTAARDVRWIYTTSGTTSAPKGVCHSDAALIAGGDSLADALGATSADVGTMFFPFAHIGGPDMLITALRTRMPLVLMEAFDVTVAAALMRKHHVTVSGGGTPFYGKFLEAQRAIPQRRLVPSLRLLAGGGAPMPPRVYHQVVDELGIPVAHGYGMTECPMITQGMPGDSATQLSTTAGRPVRGCEVEVRSAEGAVLGSECQGEVWVRGSMLFQYYLVEGSVVRPHDEDGWFFTGDVGFLRSDGHLVLVDREKDLIIRKGESISPMEIEDVLAQHAAVMDVAVIGLPDAVRGERICAVVQLRSSAPIFDVDAAREYCLAAGLSPNKSPEQVEILDELPKTPTMKTRKQQLRTLFIDEAEDLPSDFFRGTAAVVR